MHNRYSDSSTRPHSALVGSPFRNVVKRFDADIVKQHHIQTVSSAHARVPDQTEPVFAKILKRRGYDPQSGSSTSGFHENSSGGRSMSPDHNNTHNSNTSFQNQGQAYFNARLSPIHGGNNNVSGSGGGGHQNQTTMNTTTTASFSPSGPTFKTSLSSPISGGSPSSRRDMSIAAATGSSDYKQFSPTSKKPQQQQQQRNRSRSNGSNNSSPNNSKKRNRPNSGGRAGQSSSSSSSFVVGNSNSNSVFLAHKQKVREIADHGIPRKSKSPSTPSSKTNIYGNSTNNSANNNGNVRISDSNIIRAGGNSAYVDYSYCNNSNAQPSNNNNNNNNNSSARRHSSAAERNSPKYNRRGGGGGGDASPGSNHHSFGTSSSYQRWSHVSPSQVASSGNGLLGGELFAIAMRGAQSQLDDAESVEVRREIQSAIDSFLYRPVARRFSEETAKWVEDHILPYASTSSSSSLQNNNNNNRPGSATTNNNTDSSRSNNDDGNNNNNRYSGGSFGQGSGGADSIASRRQKALAMTEEVLPLLFHLVARDIRDAVRLRIEAALLKKETRTSYLG